EESASRFTNEVITILLIASTISALVGIIFSDQLTAVFARGFTGETAELCSFFIKVTFFYVFFTSTASLLEAFLQYKKVFLPQTATTILQNIVMIGTIIVSAVYDHHFLAFGLLIGYGIRMLILILIARKKNLRYRPTRRLGSAGKEIVALTLPVFIGSCVAQINQFVDKTLATGLAEGSVTALNYGYLLVNLVSALSTTVILTLIYPRLSKSGALEDYEQFSTDIGKGFNLTAIMAIPCTLGILLYSEQIVQAVYERGAFDAASTSLTSGAFFFYGVGLFFTAINLVMIRGFYALRDMKTPVFIAVLGVAINISLNLLLVDTMAHEGLALATSTSAFVRTFVYYFVFRKKYPYIQLIPSKKNLTLVCVASVVSVGLSYVLYAAMTRFWADYSLLIVIVCVIIFACLAYLVLLKIFKIEEVSLIRELIRRRR
ncbi:MAG: murein biosynthesis integral membrane protein MurJ, partial [Firmicutes bacterium]|nr:murein biosynthesis integral membrane protein MurJ [Bacillota bacterium]